MALSTVRQILRGQPVLVLGSAPLSEAARHVLSASDSYRLVCVNGGIASTTRTPDVFVLNSREYDDRIWNDPMRWPEERKQLHHAMFRQSANRAVRHLVLLLKSKAADQTIARLREQRTQWRGHTLLHGGQKMDLGRKAGITKFAIASNISAGLFGACLALVSGASRVTLLGFSYKDGHAYYPDATNHRFHISQDQHAISDLLATHASKLEIVYS